MALFHVVAFAFKDSASAEDRQQAHQTFLDLKNKCKKPDGSTYILELTGSTKNVSVESMGGNFSNLYIVKFASIADRDYYVNEDQAHGNFKAQALPMASDAFIYDYES